MFTKFKLKEYDFKLLISVLLLIGIGTVMINSADSSYTYKQLIGVAMAVVGILVVSVIDYHFICKFYLLIYAFNVLIMISVLLFGVNVGGAKRWIMVGGANGIQFQPSELSKFAIAVYMADRCVRYPSRLNDCPPFH